MKATLKLPYNYYNDGSFDVDPSYYKDGEYGERMNDEFNKTSESIYNAMSDSNKFVSRAFYQEMDNLTESVRKRLRAKIM